MKKISFLNTCVLLTTGRGILFQIEGSTSLSLEFIYDSSKSFLSFGVDFYYSS